MTERVCPQTPRRPDDGDLAPMALADVYAAPGYLIRRAHQIATAVFFEEFQNLDVTPVQYAALVAVRDRPGMDQRTLVKHVAVDRTTVGSMMRTLERRELVDRVRPDDNMRVKRLFIRPKGEAVLDGTRRLIFQVQERILAPLTGPERARFMAYLTRIVDINNELSRAPLLVGGPGPAAHGLDGGD